MTRNERRLLVCIGGAAAVAAIGVLHVPIARSLGGGCPFGKDRQVAPGPRESTRQRAVARLRGDTPARARPALQFSLGSSTRGDVVQWTRARGGTCQSGRDGLGLACQLGDRSTGGASTLYADFNPDDALVSLMWMSRPADPRAAGDSVEVARDALERELGAPTRVAGETDPTYLAAAALRQARVEFRRSDYFASVSATNLGHDTYLVSHVYQSID